MNCYRHPERNAVNTCSRCGAGLCQECSFEVDGKIICKDCVNKMLRGDSAAKESKKREPKGAPSRESGFSCCQRKSWGLLFVFSFILPGINYMYLGLIKRGLFTLSAFFLIIYGMVILNNPWLSFCIPILWVTSIFDGFQIRNKMNMGLHVEDSISDVTDFVAEHKQGILLTAIVFLGLSVLSNLTRHAVNFARHGSFSPAVLAVIILGICLFTKKKDKTRKKEDLNDVIDKRKDS